MTTAATPVWHPTACIICSLNCGVEVQVDGRSITRVRGDRANPRSHGYACEKAQRLEHHQSGRDRLTTPLRRRPDGTHEPIDWDTAIAEIATRLTGIRDEHGGERTFYYGGGGQANHLGGFYAGGTRAAAGVVFMSNALAQEKTGEFWVDGQLFGRSRCHTTPDFERCEVAVFVGKNPWQSHGFPRARVVLKELAKDPGRAMIVIDPRRTETAAMADIHLQVRPGTDAFCLSAMLAALVDEGLVDEAFLDEHAGNGEALFAELERVPIAGYSARAGVAEADVRAAARRIGTAASVAILEDLGIQQAPNSTLNSYLEKLLFLLTGNFARPGTMNIHTGVQRLGGDHPRADRTPVTDQRVITGLTPANAIADEILTDDPRRLRAMIIESSNPAHSLADSPRMREALAALELTVVIDVAMTETARLADYVLPAPTQYEKWEAGFFTLEFPDNAFQLRAPVIDPLPGPLPEPEIHRRLVRAMGVLDDVDVDALAAAARESRPAFGAALMALIGERPELQPYAPLLAYEALGPTLPDGADAAAALWFSAHVIAQMWPDSVRRAGHEGEGAALGEALFDAMLGSRHGMIFTSCEPQDTWRRMASSDGRINLSIPELLEELASLRDTPAASDEAFPFVLSAGERRSSTANTLFRDPDWHRGGADATLRMHPDDAERLGLANGGSARVTTRRGAVEAPVQITDTLQPGWVTLPNGLGLSYPGPDGDAVHGAAPNELTSTKDRDWFAGTPWHKHVRAQVEAVV